MPRKRAAISPKTPRAAKRQRIDPDEIEDLPEKDLIVSRKELLDLTPKKSSEDDLQKLLAEEKASYEGASSWAPQEERLFELLFLRQDLALLPSNWQVDFRGVPMPNSLFRSSEKNPPLIRSLSGKEFHATTALMRLIDLTAEVRTLFQSQRRHKAAEAIKDALQHYISWAAKDGGYSHLDYVPNLVVANVSGHENSEGVVRELRWRMNTLARLQRDSLRVDYDSNSFWSTSVRSSRRHSRGQRLIDRFMRVSREKSDEPPFDEQIPSKMTTDNQAKGLAANELNYVKLEDLDVRNKTPSKATGKSQETPKTPQIPPPTPRTDMHVEYRRCPPVVYGLFILRTSVLLLSIDSSKPEPAHVSYHVDIHFTDYQQSVWNAITIAMAVCLARQDLISHISDFKAAPLADDSDPDA